MTTYQTPNPSILMKPKQQHPLHQIAESPTHKLLLKQWLKEEDLILTRIASKETQIDSIRHEITQVYILFFLFHSFSLLLLFNTTSNSSSRITCKRSWIPLMSSLICSIGMIWAVRYKSDVKKHMVKLVEREKEDAKLLGKCVEELKRKGLEFDLLKEVDALRRAKSMRTESRIDKVGKWSSSDFAMFFFFVVSFLVLVLIRVILCG